MVLVVMGVVVPGGVDRHRTVEKDRYTWDLIALTQPGDMKHECLGATDGERRNHDHAAAGSHSADDRREFGFLVDRHMDPIAVSRFADEVVDSRQVLLDGDERRGVGRVEQNAGAVLAGRLMLYDGRAARFTELEFRSSAGRSRPHGQLRDRDAAG